MSQDPVHGRYVIIWTVTEIQALALADHLLPYRKRYISNTLYAIDERGIIASMRIFQHIPTLLDVNSQIPFPFSLSPMEREAWSPLV